VLKALLLLLPLILPHHVQMLQTPQLHSLSYVHATLQCSRTKNHMCITPYPEVTAV
jgi:hypothetical protein